MNLIIRETRSYLSSFIAPALVALPLSWMLELFERYIFADWEYVRYLVVFMTLDTLISWWHHLRVKDLSSRGFARLFTKLIVYAVLLIIAHGFASYTIGGEQLEPLKWFRAFICSALLVRESISIVENLNKIRPGLIPPIITKHLKDFDEKGKCDKD